MRSDEPDFRLGPILLDRLSHFRIVFQRRGRGMNNNVIVLPCFSQTLLYANVMRRAIHQFGARNEGSGLGKPCRIPEAGNFAPSLITRASATVETVKRGWAEKQGFAHYED